MDTLKKILALLVVLLFIILGVGYYLTSGMYHGNMDMGDKNKNQITDSKNGDNKLNQGNKQTGQNQNPEPNKQRVTVVLQPDITEYIDEVNKGISLINEANGLITMDPFFANPPKVPKGKVKDTPFDKLLPKDRKGAVLVYPDGTYQVVGENGVDLRNTYRGIYKLGQGMTVLNSVLDRMNNDARNNNFPLLNNTINQIIHQVRPNYYQMVPGTQYYPGNPNVPTYNQEIPNQPNISNVNPNPSNGGNNATNGNTNNVHNMPGMTQGLSIINSTTIRYLLYGGLVFFLFLIVVAITGYIGSFLKEPKTDN